MGERAAFNAGLHWRRRAFRPMDPGAMAWANIAALPHLKKCGVSMQRIAWGVVRRVLTWRGRSRPDMAVGCPSRLDMAFIRWVCTYRKTRRPAILQRLGRCSPQQRVAVLRSRREIASFLQQLQGADGA